MDVPRPPFWAGFRLIPDAVEFWQGRAFRLHDRFAYTRDDSRPAGWRIERLAP
jgi:pyridoxamine 5'-phosphate oxidase